MSVIFTSSRPDYASLVLNTGWNRFTSKQGIDGLMRINGLDLELLAVFAAKPGTGQFRRFITACKGKFDTVAVWEIWNDDLPTILTRYGFIPVEKTEDDGEVIRGFCWKRA